MLLDSDFVLCETLFWTMLKSRRLAELIDQMGDDAMAWSICRNETAIEIAEPLRLFGELLVEHLDPAACLPSPPPEGARCQVHLEPLEPGAGCTAGTVEGHPGQCELAPNQWEVVETDRCTELRLAPELELAPATAAVIRCLSSSS